MATYRYKCRNCDNDFEIQQSMKEDSLKHCEKCGEDELYRVIYKDVKTSFKGNWFKSGGY